MRIRIALIVLEVGALKTLFEESIRQIVPNEFAENTQVRMRDMKPLACQRMTHQLAVEFWKPVKRNARIEMMFSPPAGSGDRVPCRRLPCCLL